MAIHETLLDYVFPRHTRLDFPRISPRPIRENRESLRARGMQYLDYLTAAHEYHGSTLLQEMIATLKYRRERGLAHALGSMLAEVCPLETSAMLCPVPLHWSRYVFRGFNQAHLLCTVVSQMRNIPMQTLLKRVRSTGHQASRTRRERLRSLNGCFANTSQKLPSHVLLVDDLTTTGATLDECAKCLKNVGVEVVEAVVVARA